MVTETFSKKCTILKKIVNGKECEQFQNNFPEGTVVIPMES